MINKEAINYLKHNCRKMCQDCYPEIGRGGSESCNFCNEAEAYDTAIEALEKINRIMDAINYCENCEVYHGIKEYSETQCYEDIVDIIRS